jgi:hypothetical protein
MKLINWQVLYEEDKEPMIMTVEKEGNRTLIRFYTQLLSWQRWRYENKGRVSEKEK